MIVVSWVVPAKPKNTNERGIVVRLEAPVDVAPIHEVHLATFPTAAEATLVDALRSVGLLRVSLVAALDGQVVGHVAFSPVTLDGAPTCTGGLGLAPLGVKPAFQRRGIGSELVRAGLVTCARAGFDFAVVLGEPGYYMRFGFRPASQWSIGNVYGAGPEFMAVEFRAHAIPPRPGTARYSKPFDAVA